MTLFRIGVIFYGLGNQMMSYLYYKARTELTGEKIYLWAPSHKPLADHNGYELDRIFHIKPIGKFWSEIIWHLYKHRNNKILRHFISARRDTFTDISAPRTGCKLIHFIMAGDKDKDFYTKRREEILETYTFDESMANPESQQWLSKIQQDSGSCSLHVRRGDYIGHPNFDNICTPNYYRNAIAEIQKRVQTEVTFYVFSDDIDWCREEFGDKGFKYVNCNHGKDSWQDMMLISRCRHHIMANSTFSWWGSFLGEKEGSFIICPPKFSIKDNGENYPPTWIRCHK